jgi:3-hydroxyacyl-CoA dehydrogenase
MGQVVKYETIATLAIVTIDNPPVNALSHAVREGLAHAFASAAKDDAIETVLLICDGRTFIAGADIREFDQPPRAPHLPDLLNRIEAVNKPVVAAIHGTALGGGLETAMACHYRCASSDARLGLPEVNLGLLPGAGGTQRLPRLVGVELALDMMVGGRPIGARQALAAGLIDEIIESDELRDGAIRWARQLAASSAGTRQTAAIAIPEEKEAGFFASYRAKIARRTRGLLSPELIVQCVEDAVSAPFADALARERERFMQCKASPQSAALRHLFFAEREVARIPGLDSAASPRPIRTVAVLGAGTMGSGIALACLGAGFEVRLLDSSDEALGAGRQRIASLLQQQVDKGRIRPDQAAANLDRLGLVSEYGSLSEADLVIEAVFENLDVKTDVFASLDRFCRPGAVLATNTSTLDIDRIAAATTRPHDVIGLHFFSPAHVMRLLEIVRGRETSDAVIATAMAFARQLRKVGVLVGNCFGFVGNRMLYGYGRESQMLLLEGVAPERIDQVLYDWGMAMGPHAVGDLAGLDVGYRVRQERTDRPDDPCFYRIADMLVERGRFGQKTGMGMYDYREGERVAHPSTEVREMIRAEAKRLGIVQREIDDREILERCIFALINEGARCLEEGIALRAADIDVIWVNGYGFPRYRGGPMFYASQIGLRRVYQGICHFRETLDERYWQPAALLEKAAAGDSAIEW